MTTRLPQTSKQWSVKSTSKGFDGLHFEEAAIPEIAAYEVLVKFHAVALNYRDLMILKVFERARFPERLEDTDK